MRGFGLKDAQPRCRSKDRFRRPSNGQCEQPNHPDYEDCERDGIIVEPMLPLCLHDLKPSLERVPDSRPNAAKAVTCVTGIPASQLPPVLSPMNPPDEFLKHAVECQ